VLKHNTSAKNLQNKLSQAIKNIQISKI